MRMMRSKSILLIDGDENHLHRLKRAILTKDYTVDSANNG